MPTSTYYAQSTEQYQNYATDDALAATAYNQAHNCIEPYHSSRDVDYEPSAAVGQLCYSHTGSYPAGFLVHAANRSLLFFYINHSEEPITAIRLILWMHRSSVTTVPEFTDYNVSIRNLIAEDVERLDPYNEVYPKLLLGTEIALKYVPDIPDYESGVWYKYEFELEEGDIDLSGWTPISVVTSRDVASIVPTSIPDPGTYELIYTYVGEDRSARRLRVEVDYAVTPTVTTDAASLIAQNTATLNGNLDADGDETCSVRFQYGLTSSYGTNTDWQSGFGTGDPFSQAITGLDAGTTYHFRAQARNSAGTVSSSDATFTTVAPPTPAVTTDNASDIAREAAVLNGTLDDDGGESCDCGFEWGLTDAYGHTTLTESKIASESFSRAIGGLFPGTSYHFRAFATNSAGTSYGADRNFTSTPTFSRAHALSREEL